MTFNYLNLTYCTSPADQSFNTVEMLLVLQWNCGIRTSRIQWHLSKWRRTSVASDSISTVGSTWRLAQPVRVSVCLTILCTPIF